MAKKTSRQVSKETQTSVVETVDTVAPVQRATLVSRSAPAIPDYSYVKKDLRKIGILAGSMFAAMILLYFILPYILPLYAR